MDTHTLTIKLAGDIGDLIQKMNAAERTVGAGMKSIESAASSAMKMIGGLAAGLSVGALVGKLVSVQREFDVLNSSLITVSGGSANAAREMEWIKQFAKDTPFGLAQATQGFVKMKALGLDPSMASLTSYGNTASAMGKDLNQMVEAVADAATGEFERLKEFGIKASKQGSDVSLTFQGVTTKIGNNAQAITGYLEAIGNHQFAGAMEERAKTLDGTISALGDTWDELFRTINDQNAGSLIFDAVTLATGAIENAIVIIKAMSAASADGAQETGALASSQEFLATVFETVAVLAVNLKYVLESVGREIGGLIAQIVQFAQSGGGAFILYDVITKGKSTELDAMVAIGDAMKADAAAARIEVDATTARILGARQAAEELSKWNTRNASAATDARRLDLAAAGASGKGAKSVDSKAIDAANKAMAEQAKLLAELAGLSGSFYEDWEARNALYRAGKISVEQLTQAQAELLAKQPAMVAAAKEQIEAAKASNAAFDEQFKAIEAVREATEGRIKSAREMLESIERETSLMGLSNQEREQAIALFELERQGVVKGTEAYEAYAQKIKAAINVRSGKQATQELNNATTAEWTKTVDKYDDIFRGGFADMLNNGKGAWDSFTTSLTTTFKTSVADQMYKMFAQPFVVKFVASMLGIAGGAVSSVASASSAVSTGSSVLSGASALSSLGSGAGMAAQFYSGLSGSAGAASAMMGGAQLTTAAQMGASINGVIASIGPVGWAAIAVLAVAAIASGRGETRSGASYVTGKDGKAVKEMGPSGGEIAGDQVRALFDTTTAGINSLLKSLGSQASVSAFVAGLESSKAGKGFVYAGGTLSTGAKFGEAGGRNGGEFAFGGQTSEEAIKGYALQLKQATLQALMVAGDIPKQITAIIGSVDVTNVAEGVLDSLMGQINVFVVGVGAMQSALELLPINYLKDLSFATAAGLAEAAGGFDQFGASLGAFYDKFYTESEKTANATANLSNAFAAMNIVMPAVDENTRAWYRSEVERLGAMDLSIAANAKAYTSVLSLNSAVDALAPAMKAAADATKAAADATKSTTDAALRSLTAAIEAEQKRVGLIRDLAAESVSSITSVFDLLKEQVAQLYGSVGSTRMMQAGQGNAFIDAALAAVKSTGYLPDSTQLADAIAAARGGLDASQFTSQFEVDKAALVMAGKLSQIQAAAGKQLTSAEQSLRVAEGQLAVLDESLEYYKTQVDLLRGIDTSVLTVAGAIAALQVAMTAEKSASTAPGTKATASAITGAGYAPAGQGPATQDTGFKDRIYLPNGIVVTAITDLDRIGRLDSISAYLAEGHSINEIAETAIKYGVTQKDLAAASGYTDHDVRKTFEGLGIPAYANGGDHAGGLRLVGEKSWEIEATGPSRIWNPQQLGDALRGGGGGNDQTDVADELRQLREENRAQARVVAQLLSDMNKRQREWDTNGLPTERAMA